MPKLSADISHLESVVRWIGGRPALGHLRAKKRGDTITIVSGPEDDAIPHARLRRSTILWWTVEVATHNGRWEPMPIRTSIREALDELAQNYGWVLVARE